MPSSLAFAVFWADPVLVRDYAVLVRCGHVQRRAFDAGTDTPAGWWAGAARCYGGSDEQSAVARTACRLTAASLAEGRPS